MVNTSSLKADELGVGALTGSFTWIIVRVGFTRPSTKPSWMPSASERGSPRAKAWPDTTDGGAPAAGRVVDQVERAELVVGPPPAPVAHPGRDLGEAAGTGTRAHYRRASRSAPAVRRPGAGRTISVVGDRAGRRY